MHPFREYVFLAKGRAGTEYAVTLLRFKSVFTFFSAGIVSHAQAARRLLRLSSKLGPDFQFLFRWVRELRQHAQGIFAAISKPYPPTSERPSRWFTVFVCEGIKIPIEPLVCAWTRRAQQTPV
jgi:hypothetical protein